MKVGNMENFQLTNTVVEDLTRRPTSYLLSISSPTDHEWNTPAIGLTLPLAEMLHRALVGRAAGGARIDAPELTGHSIDGQPLLGPHRHAYLLPVDLDQDGQLDHVIVHASMGFGTAARSAIESLRWLNFDFDLPRPTRSEKKIGHPNVPIASTHNALCSLERIVDKWPEWKLAVRIVNRWGWRISNVQTSGRDDDSMMLPGIRSDEWEGALEKGALNNREMQNHDLINRLYGMKWADGKSNREMDRLRPQAPESSSSRPASGKRRANAGGLIWRSVTPMVLPRYLKRSGKNNLTGQVQAELASRGLPAADQIDVIAQIDTQSSGTMGTTSGFVLNRNFGGKRAPQTQGYFLVIRFADPVVGPLAIGYASHFGLGLFSAIEAGRL